MRFVFVFLAAGSVALVAPALASEPKAQPVEEQSEAKEPKKICRYVAEIGSRRKTRMCMTVDQWREFNQGE